MRLSIKISQEKFEILRDCFSDLISKFIRIDWVKTFLERLSGNFYHFRKKHRQLFSCYSQEPVIEIELKKERYFEKPKLGAE